MVMSTGKIKLSTNENEILNDRNTQVSAKIKPPDLNLSRMQQDIKEL